MTPEEGSPHSRTILVLVAVASSFLIFATTERCFGKADIRNAITLTQTLRAHPDAPTLPEALARRHDVRADTVAWSGTLTDNCYGFVRVRAAVPGPGAVREYLFDVNLAGQRLHPANDSARALMEELRPPALPKEPSAPRLPAE